MWVIMPISALGDVEVEVDVEEEELGEEVEGGVGRRLIL
jgi:hypothetical protein